MEIRATTTLQIRVILSHKLFHLLLFSLCRGTDACCLFKFLHVLKTSLQCEISFFKLILFKDVNVNASAQLGKSCLQPDPYATSALYINEYHIKTCPLEQYN